MTKDYQVGDKVVFDGNRYGVTPKLGTATIIGISNGFGISGLQRPPLVYNVEAEDGYRFSVDEGQVIGLAEDSGALDTHDTH